MQKPNPRGCCGNPGICLKCAQGQKSLKGLPRATHCTDRAQTSSNVSPTVELCPPHPTFGTKVRTRRDVAEGEFFFHNYTYTYTVGTSNTNDKVLLLLYIASGVRVGGIITRYPFEGRVTKRRMLFLHFAPPCVHPLPYGR